MNHDYIISDFATTFGVYIEHKLDQDLLVVPNRFILSFIFKIKEEKISKEYYDGIRSYLRRQLYEYFKKDYTVSEKEFKDEVIFNISYISGEWEIYYETEKK